MKKVEKLKLKLKVKVKNKFYGFASFSDCFIQHCFAGFYNYTLSKLCVLGILFSRCPSICPSIRLSICLSIMLSFLSGESNKHYLLTFLVLFSVLHAS